jgi:hypothetical protein
MIWFLVFLWIIGVILFGFSIWAAAVGFMGVFSQLGRPARGDHREELSDSSWHGAERLSLHVVNFERPPSWHLHPLHSSHTGVSGNYRW